MHKTFQTPAPVQLFVEFGPGRLQVQAEETDQTTVTVEGRNPEEVAVEQRGSQIAVVAPSRRLGPFGSAAELSVTVSVPTDSALTTKLGSADLVASGRYGVAKLKSGSGDIQIDELGGAGVIESGSGDVAVNIAFGDLRVKTGSGDVGIERAAATLVVATGSGDVFVGVTEGTASVKSGSGDVSIKETQSALTLTTASGDVVVGSIPRGSIQAKGVSGDIRVGVPAGIPVWTDVSCVTGDLTSNLEGAGQPDEGEDYIEVRASTVSGDIRLEQV